MKLIKPKLKETTKKFKPIKLPSEITPELAELIGIHFGDGNIYTRKKECRITYSFNSKEKQLINHTKDLFSKLFDATLNEHEERNGAISLVFSSKPLSHFLKDNFGTPFGRKNNLIVPNIIKTNPIYIKSFLRGLHWTDGCAFIKKDKKKYQYPIIKITTKCQHFSEEIKEELIKLGFRATINRKSGFNYVGYDVTLHGTKQYRKWISEISDKKKIKNGAAGIRISEQ